MSTDNMSWVNRNKFLVVVVVMLLIWTSFLVYLFRYGEAVIKDPCTACAKRLNEDIFCTAGTNYVSKRIFYGNGSIKTEVPFSGDVDPTNVTISNT